MLVALVLNPFGILDHLARIPKETGKVKPFLLGTTDSHGPMAGRDSLVGVPFDVQVQLLAFQQARADLGVAQRSTPKKRGDKPSHQWKCTKTLSKRKVVFDSMSL